ncbi:MAG TPA: DNA-3-methyladenine glycosylase 2 family protein [Marmoricola sp.]|nr:DNA-3-methyladenine glycosylase 2 family protein [Marmoricola sp.]
MAPVTRTWRPAWPCDVAQVLAPLRHGRGDPTYHRAADGSHWRGVLTPVGPGTLRVTAEPAAGRVQGQAWGAGAEWLLDALPRMLGADDDPAGFEPRHRVLVDLWRRHAHLRIGASGLVMESLVPAIIEQKVTGQEAFAAFRRLVQRYGEPAPGPVDALRLRVQPTPQQLRAVPSWEWLRLPVDGARSRPIQHVARVADALERAGRTAPAEFDRRVRTIPGIGVWTSAETRGRSLGDADAVSFGDYHVARDIGWALTGVEVDDDGLAELLTPYAGHRLRVQRLVERAGLHRPRRGARMAPRTHLPVR